jgi:hypothetical protein
MRGIFVIVCLLLAVVVLAQRAPPKQTGPLPAIRQGLARYQTLSGGFKNSAVDEFATAEATENALLLVSLFGLRSQINAFEASKFLATLLNSDGGYGSVPQRPSDIASVRNVVLSYHHLGLTVPNPANVVSYIKTLQSPAGTFSNRLGERPDLQSTFFAVQALDLLQETRILEELAPLLKTYLADHITDTRFEFEDEDSVDALVGTYYGMMIAKAIRFDIPNRDSWKSYLYQQSQAPEASVLSISSGFVCLYEIDPSQTATAYIESYFFQKAEDGLRDAAAAYRAIARSADMKTLLATHLDFELDIPANDDSFVQGANIKPVLLTRTSLGTEHPGLDVEVLLTYGDEEPQPLKLQWSQEDHMYQPYTSFGTDGKLGALLLDVNVRYYVASIGELSFPTSMTRHIGYGILVDSEAEQPLLGKKINVGEEVSSGTNFQFTVRLRNSTDAITRGDFDVVFDVLDASRIVLHSQSVSASTQQVAELVFKYTLTNTNIPSGALSFRVGIRDTGIGLIHSSKVVQYAISTPMVASQIEFEDGNAEYVLGSDVVITMVPASYDLQTVHPFSRLDAHNADISSHRLFYVDLVTAKKDVVFSAPGRAIADGGDHLKLRFVIPIAPTLDFLGQNEVVFRYVTDRGQSESTLSNFDSRSNQLYDAASPFGFAVHSELAMVSVIERPKPDADFFYGNEISFQFKLQDTISERYVSASEKAFGNVFLTLQHSTGDDSRPFVSVKEPATMEGDYFVINWAINPNAVSGDGVMIVSAEDAAGQSHPILSEPGGESVQFPVKIGGDIDLRHNSFSTEVSGESAFIVDFSLYCNGKVLNDARLRATVSLSSSSQTLVRTSVATSEGRYQTSWTAKDAPSGTYVLQFYRETDLARAQELRSQRERKLRSKAELGDIESEVKPLFQVQIQHEAAPKAVLPVRTEVFVIGFLLLCYLALLSQKP